MPDFDTWAAQHGSTQSFRGESCWSQRERCVSWLYILFAAQAWNTVEVGGCRPTNMREREREREREQPDESWRICGSIWNKSDYSPWSGTAIWPSKLVTCIQTHEPHSAAVIRTITVNWWVSVAIQCCSEWFMDAYYGCLRALLWRNTHSHIMIVGGYVLVITYARCVERMTATAKKNVSRSGSVQGLTVGGAACWGLDFWTQHAVVKTLRSPQIVGVSPTHFDATHSNAPPNGERVDSALEQSSNCPTRVTAAWLMSQNYSEARS